jgi:hypothetical protein
MYKAEKPTTNSRTTPPTFEERNFTTTIVPIGEPYHSRYLWQKSESPSNQRSLDNTSLCKV